MIKAMLCFFSSSSDVLIAFSHSSFYSKLNQALTMHCISKQEYFYNHEQHKHLRSIFKNREKKISQIRGAVSCNIGLKLFYNNVVDTPHTFPIEEDSVCINKKEFHDL